MYTIITRLLSSLTLLLFSVIVNAQQVCPEPSNIKLNYLPVSIVNEFCFDYDIKHILSGVDSLFVNMYLEKTDINLTAIQPGVFFNVIVHLGDGSKNEYSFLTVDKPVVEKVYLINAENGNISYIEP
jgi:hypothetical protein